MKLSELDHYRKRERTKKAVGQEPEKDPLLCQKSGCMRYGIHSESTQGGAFYCPKHFVYTAEAYAEGKYYKKS